MTTSYTRNGCENDYKLVAAKQLPSLEGHVPFAMCLLKLLVERNKHPWYVESSFTARECENNFSDKLREQFPNNNTMLAAIRKALTKLRTDGFIYVYKDKLWQTVERPRKNKTTKPKIVKPKRVKKLKQVCSIPKWAKLWYTDPVLRETWDPGYKGRTSVAYPKHKARIAKMAKTAQTMIVNKN